MHHVSQVLRSYLGITQYALSQRAGITQADLSEIERQEPYGSIVKYERLAEALGVPVQALAMNDFRAIPKPFFDAHPAPAYRPPSQKGKCAIGRAGEEAALSMERERLKDSCPALAKLVLPYFKMKCTSPGYDILSFDDNGRPFCIEVKTTTNDEDAPFKLSAHEFSRANALTEEGVRYLLYRYSNWGTPAQKLRIIPFEEFRVGGRVIPTYYTCSFQEPKPITGIAYYRNQRGLRQGKLAEDLGIHPTKLSAYERGVKKAPVKVYMRLSELLDASIDDLLREYQPGELCYEQ